MQIRTSHVQGAVTLVGLIGPTQLTGAVGRGIYLRIRENMVNLLPWEIMQNKLTNQQLAHCFLTRDPFPEFLLEPEGVEQQDCNPVLWRLFSRLCQVRSDHKIKGSVDTDMAIEAQHIMDELEIWEQSIPEWKPSETTLAALAAKCKEDDPHRYVWLWTLWMLHQTSRILASELVINWARAQVLLTPGVSTSETVDNAISAHIEVCEELRERTDFHLNEFRSMEAGIGTIASYDLLWPLFILASSSTSTKETMVWIIKSAELIGAEFGIRQAKILVDGMKMYM